MKVVYLFLMTYGYKLETLRMLTTDNILQLARDVRGWVK